MLCLSELFRIMRVYDTSDICFFNSVLSILMVQFQSYIEIVIPDQANQNDVNLKHKLLPEYLPIAKEDIAAK